ncbi:MAG: histidine kinase [Actinomycetota bacterium]
MFYRRKNILSKLCIYFVFSLVFGSWLAFLVYLFGPSLGIIFEGRVALPLLTALITTGIFLSLTVFLSLKEEPEHGKAMQSHQILEIANQTLPYLRTGLNSDSASKVAEIIHKESDALAVALTDLNTVLAFTGGGKNHHRAGKPIMTKATRESLKYDETRILKSREEIGCPVLDCPLQAAIVVPLELRGKAVGALKFYYDNKEKLTESRVTVAEGLARLLSTQLELSEIDKQRELACKAELKALQAQINPHFLYNTLNTIAMFCRTKPDRARKLLIQFADFFRKTLERGSDMVTLEEELDYVNSYLIFEKARFGEKLRIIEDIDPSTLNLKLPALVLQPIVENAVKHGLTSNGLKIKISSELKNSEMIIKVEDNGVGIPSTNMHKILLSGLGKGMGIGLSNVNERLKSLYGDEYRLNIDSEMGKGTVVTLRILCFPDSSPGRQAGYLPEGSSGRFS